MNDAPAADRLWRAISAAGAGLALRSNDHLVQRFAEAAAVTSDRRGFAAPHARLANARTVLETAGTLAAIDELESILRDLKRLRSPAAPVIAVEIATLLFHASEYRRVLEMLDSNPVDEKVSPITAARAAWNRGVALTSLGRVRAAADSYGRALELFGAAGDRSQAGPLLMLFADNAELAGDLDEAWSRYLTGLAEVERHGEPERGILILDTFCRAALRRDYSGFAELLNDAVISRSNAPHLRPFLVHALVTRCELESRRGRFDAAREECAAARQAWSSITDGSVRARLEADLEIATAAASDPKSRLDALNRAVRVSSDRGDLYRQSRVLLLRARTYLALGARRLAEGDFEQSLSTLEDQRQRLEAVPDKLTYFETSRSAAGELIRLMVDEKRYADAFAVVERVRARALLDRMTDSPSAVPLSISEIRKAIPDGERLVVYWCDPNETFIWIVSQERVAFQRSAVARRAISEAARRFTDSMESENDTDDGGPGSQILFKALAAPVLSDMESAENVTIVPDSPFADVSFAALRDPVSGRYLVETVVLKRSPSASAFAKLPRPSLVDSVLVVADPILPDQPRLDVAAEVRSAIRTIPRAAVYAREEATESVLASRAREFGAIHIAAHGFDDTGAGPAVGLTPEQGRGLLTVHDVESMRLREGALVVLAACRTARGRHMAEGTMSMARAFMVAGAGSVVAALWDVPDSESSLLFAEFYRALGAGATPAQALRIAQTAMIRRQTFTPRSWAAYQIHGGT
jgi:CHAT domain-containing protein